MNPKKQRANSFKQRGAMHFKPGVCYILDGKIMRTGAHNIVATQL